MFFFLFFFTYHLTCFGGFVSLVSVVSVVLFRSFRFVVSGFSTCPQFQVMSEEFHHVEKINC